MKKRKVNLVYVLLAILAIVCVVLGYGMYQKQKKYVLATENGYNMALYEVIDYVQNVESYLAKSLLSTSPEHGAMTLTNVWREANLASSYLAQLPVENQELLSTQKFLNQVSDYSYSLSRKNMKQESLTEDDLKQLEQLHQYSVELGNSLTQLSTDMTNGKVSWKDFTQNRKPQLAQQVSNIKNDLFSNINKNFEQYAGLIYDGAYSEHANEGQMKALGNQEIGEETAKEKASEWIGKDRVEAIDSQGFVENGKIPCYDFTVCLKGNEKETVTISISKKGGMVVAMNENRNVEAEAVSQEEAVTIGNYYLTNHGFPNMKETYYIQQDGVLTINYAYQQDNVIMYPDLIKVKVALDNGEILGVESTGYLNSHTIRDVTKVKIDAKTAKKTLNPSLQIESERLAVIPTDWGTEILCWEFKGKIGENEFLVYMNVENGKEENSLLVEHMPNGTLTM